MANTGLRKVRFRPLDDVVAEMRAAQDTCGIRDFAFYADFLLLDHEHHFQPLLEALVADSRFYRLYADDRFLRQLNRRHVKLEHFVRAAQMCERAGFDLRHMDVNSFVLYGLPGERIDDVVRLYIKLPNWFVVRTPVGEYNPDWAIVMEDRDQHGSATGPILYLVRETKDTTILSELPPEERRKVICGSRHFNDAVGVSYQVVSSTDQLPDGGVTPSPQPVKAAADSR